jgi:hypothetical protein
VPWRAIAPALCKTSVALFFSDEWRALHPRRIVFGVEGDLDAASLQGTAPCAVVLNCTMKHNWFADIIGIVYVFYW